MTLAGQKKGTEGCQKGKRIGYKNHVEDLGPNSDLIFGKEAEGIPSESEANG